MKKQILSFILAACVIFTLIPGTIFVASATETITDEIIQTRIDELDHLLSGKYFTQNGQGCCKWSSNHGCANCNVNNVIKSQWFKNLFGTVQTSQLFLSGGKSCMGFVEFAEWYIFRANNRDTVLRGSSTKYSNGFNYNTISKNAETGDYIRVNGHSFILISVDSSGVEVLDCNSYSTYNCIVKRHRIEFSNKSYAGKTIYISKMYSKSAGFPVRGTTPSSGTTSSQVPPHSDTGGHWEYRYVGYTTSNSRHECWCETYLKNKFGSANLRCSDWSSTRYSSNGSNWTCGSSCKGNHTGIAFTGSNRAPYWSEYTLPDGKNYYWEEKRWVEDTQTVPPPTCTQHVKGNMLYCESVHPHRNYYVCSVCGKEFTDDVANYVDSCEICNPKPPTPVGHWEQRGWTTTPVSTSDTIRNIETRTVETSPSRTEYRYVGYATTDGRHECWCETYLRGKFGSAVLRYSDWSTARYSANGSAWSCGQCNGNHTSVDHYGNDGRAWWAEFTLPDGRNFYWEESRTVPAQYRTEYKYEKWVPD
ncbi:hypothetical protein [Colidextribacter sp. OB.20]|uniref:hypothetical protein n=1 Tax=Colidextribacter sp. OB.20 TaxID=2304568 RepID=UPI00136F51EA|nr:hypothetical protein [Colidextribacter sp. OB.20]